MISMKKKIYLDSTVPNYVFNDEYKEKQKAAELLFQNAKQGKVFLFVSAVTIAEIQASDEPKRSNMLKCLEGCALYEKTTQFSHIVRLSTISLLQKVNLDLGFQTPQIRSPEELL